MRRWGLAEEMENGTIAFDGVDEVEEAVEDEAVEDEGVKEADGRTFFEGAALKERGGKGVAEAAGEMIEAGFGVGDAAADAEVEASRKPCEARDARGDEGKRRGETGDTFCGNGSMVLLSSTARVRSYLCLC